MSNMNLVAKTVVRGALVADAATMPLHWIYKSDDLMKAISNEDKSKPEFNSILSSPFYGPKDFPGHYGLGDASPYGEQFVALLTIYRELQTSNDEAAATATTTTEALGNDLASKFTAWSSSKYTGRKDHAMKELEENYQVKGLRYPRCGAGDNQAQCLYKSIIAVAAASDCVIGGPSPASEEEEEESKVSPLEALVRFHQNDDVALECAAFYHAFLSAVAEACAPKDGGGEGQRSGTTSSLPSLRELYDDVRSSTDAPTGRMAEQLDYMEGHLDSSTSDYLSAWSQKYGPEGSPYKAFSGLSCANPQALMRTLHVILRADSYEDGIRTNILVGGDNCSTAMAIGAVLGLYHGVPESWAERTNSLNVVEK